MRWKGSSGAAQFVMPPLKPPVALNPAQHTTLAKHEFSWVQFHVQLSFALFCFWPPHMHISWRLVLSFLSFSHPFSARFPTHQLRLPIDSGSSSSSSSSSSGRSGCDLLCRRQRQTTHCFQLFAITNKARSSWPDHRNCVNTWPRNRAGMAINKPKLSYFYLLSVLT